MADFEISKVQDPLPEQEAAPDYWSGRDNFAGYASRPSWRAAFSLLPRAFFAFGCNAVKKNCWRSRQQFGRVRPVEQTSMQPQLVTMSNWGTTTDSG
ncbi:hypothetical protein [Sinorhizobium psoraleae]|uniref:hypothetical protein n=1 Tax=Sinorhizobium psoraleae TaxID=520838 RepID=UPI001567EE36|nr:hypothetical protein [Sinorhizobium psoraleae]